MNRNWLAFCILQALIAASMAALASDEQPRSGLSSAPDAAPTYGYQARTRSEAVDDDPNSFIDVERARAQTVAALARMQRKDYRSAAALFKSAAAQGDPRAQTNLGWMYVLGQGMPRDDQRAVFLFRTAATKGFPNAEDSLGWMYQHGRGVAKDNSIAMGWYQKAAARGFVKAKKNLAAMQRQGWTPIHEGP